MDAKTVAGKSVFFVLICLFVVVYSAVFGQENSLTGVVVVVLALMMLGRDLSVRPLMNLAGLVAMTLAMGVGAFLSVWCGNAYIGAVINFALVFAFSYLTTQDLRSPMHFPFLLGYAFMLAVPVGPEELPVRVLALVVGSVFIVALNVLINRNRHARTCHGGIVSICEEVKACCRRAAEEGSADPSELDALCLRLRGSMYDRLRASFFSTGYDRRVLDMVSSLQMAGHAVCSGRCAGPQTDGLVRFLDAVADHENGRSDAASVGRAADLFVSAHPEADGVLVSAVVSVADTVTSLDDGGRRSSVRGRMRAVAREEVRTDSARFTFAVRMSVLFTVWAFVWQNWDLENAKWLLFTTVALVLPYVDGAWRKSAMRLTGTLAGVAVFLAAMFALGGDVGLLSVALIVANYIYTVLDPKRYDVMMIFITFSALIAASMSAPADDAVAERVLFILAGVVTATAANYLVLPYRISDENASLGRRYMRLNERMLDRVRSSLEGGDGDDYVESLTAAGISSKMHMNLEADPDGGTGLFLSGQDSVSAGCSFLCRNASALTDGGRAAALDVLDGSDPDVSGLCDGDRAYVSVLRSVMETSEESRRRYASVR